MRSMNFSIKRAGLLLFAVALLMFGQASLFGQASPAHRTKSYAGTPTAGDCTAATIGVLTAVNTTPDPDSIYDCVTVSSTPTWVVRNNTAGVTSVGWTGGIVTVNTPTTTPAFVIAGTSGGVVCFTSTSAWASSTAPASGQIMIWGGAGACPTGTAASTYQLSDQDLTDIAALSPSRGALIRRGASAWEIVALGGANALMSSDGTDAVWLARVSASSAIDFASVADGACLENTFTLTGAALGDPLAIGVATALPAGVSADARVSATDTAQIQVCNLSGAAVDLSSRTWTARVVR